MLVMSFLVICIKKDVHPMVRKELNRLKGFTKAEKEKLENIGKTVLYDHKSRKVLVNGVFSKDWGRASAINFVHKHQWKIV